MSLGLNELILSHLTIVSFIWYSKVKSHEKLIWVNHHVYLWAHNYFFPSLQNVTILASCQDGTDIHKILQRRKPDFIVIGSLDVMDKSSVVRSSLARHRKVLDESPFNNQVGRSFGPWTCGGSMYHPSIHRLSELPARFNSLAPGKFEWNFRYVIFKRISVIDICSISCETALIWMSLDFTDDQSTLVQVMAWCHQATSHYLNQCWPRSPTPYGITWPLWVSHLVQKCPKTQHFLSIS